MNICPDDDDSGSGGGCDEDDDDDDEEDGGGGFSSTGMIAIVGFNRMKSIIDRKHSQNFTQNEKWKCLYIVNRIDVR